MGIISWIIFGALIAGHYLRGWRGRFAVRMTLAGFAQMTERIPLGVLVSGAGYRNPGLLVKQATALDHLCGGRLTLGSPKANA